MATNRRVTVVNPWIPGGEVLVVFVFRPLGWLFKHFFFSIFFLILPLLLLTVWDWAWWAALILFPLLVLFTRILVTTLWLWYRNPSVPLFARRT
jgi:hypothetical protein